jgi:phosphate/sulfate permease
MLHMRVMSYWSWLRRAMIDLLLLLAVVLCFFFGWNNSSFLIGNMRGSGVTTLGTAILVSTIGLLVGVILLGPEMTKSLNGALATSVTSYGLEITLVISIIFTVFLTIVKLPASFSATIVAAFLGVAMVQRLNLNIDQIYLVISFWFVSLVYSDLF